MKKSLIIAFSILLASCATPHVVETTKIGDNGLTCDQIKQQVAEAEEFGSKAQKEKGVTGTNAAAALLFWPAMIATYQNANDAIDAARKRKEHLTELYNKKGCK